MTNTSNLHDLNYSALADKFSKPARPIIDIHAHIHGEQACLIYKRAAELYSIGTTYSMTSLETIPSIRQHLGDSVRFIAMANFAGKDRHFEFGKGYADRIKAYHAAGARIAKLWTGPRLFDGSSDPYSTNPLRLDSSMRLETARVAVDLGMKLMVHVADPDTWFATKYSDSNKYGTKLQQYEALEVLLDTFDVPVIAAHMGGYPENLNFLSDLLSRHANLFLDCSAAKWVVRELSKYPTSEVQSFFCKWQGRLLFGSDIVTADAHLTPEHHESEIAAKASAPEEAFDLYASRYWAFRTLLETDFDGPSPIADPDLHMVEPQKYSLNSSPNLRGHSLPRECLDSLYFGAANALGL